MLKMTVVAVLLLMAGLASAQTQTFYPVVGTCMNSMATCNLHGNDGNGTSWNLAWFHDALHDTITFDVHLNGVATMVFTCSPTGLTGLPAPLGSNFTVGANCTDTATNTTLTFGTLDANLSGIEFDSIYEAVRGGHQWAHQPISGGVVITQ